MKLEKLSAIEWVCIVVNSLCVGAIAYILTWMAMN